MPRYRFGGFILDTDAVELSGPDGVRELEPQVFAVLEHLVAHGGRLVTKEDLLDGVWGDRFVSESAVTTRIKQARRAVDDDGQAQWAIKTVHGRGYRFLPEVEEVGPEPAAPRPAVGDGEPPDRGLLPEELGTDARRPFCGRSAELARCLDLLDRADGADGYGWIWVLGEPGIGKTRLAAEVARDAAVRGHQVLFGRNSEDLRVPYQPFLEALRPGAEGRRGPPTAAGPDLVRALVPDSGADPSHGDDAAGGVGARTIGTSADDETQRYELFEGVAGALAELSRDRPTLVVVDDVHWAADSTLQLLAHLQRRPVGAPVTFVLTARDTAPDTSARVSDLLAAAQGRPSTELLRLAGLSDEEARSLLGEVDDLELVMRQTAGNPLFLQALGRADGSVDMQSAVRRRLASLQPSVQDALRLGSVLGLEFELRVAAEADGRDELDLLDDLETAVAARLLDDVGPDRFRFAHALVRSTLRDELSSSRRARVHGRVAAAIDRLHPGDAAHLPELAHHTAEAAAADASVRPLAVERLRRAAQESTAQLSFAEAADLLEQARSLADGIEGLEPRWRAELALEHGSAESRAGRNMPAARAFADGIVAARESGDLRLRIEAALRYEDATWRPGLSGTVALGHVEEVAEALDAASASGVHLDGELELRARLAVARLRALAMSGRREEAEETFLVARALAAELGSPDVEADVISVYLGQVRFYEDPGDAEEMLDRLAELAPEIRDGDVALHALHDRITYCTLIGDHDRRRELVREMAVLQERSHSSFWSFIRANQEAMEALYAGDLVAAEELAERSLALADRLPDEDGSGPYGLRMFMIRREQDRLATLAPLVRHVLSTGQGGDALWTPGLALLLAETGSLDEAAVVLEPVRAAGFHLPLDAMWSTVMVLLVDAVVALDDRESCEVLRRRIEPLRGLNVTTGSGLLCFGRAERYLGKLALVLGDLGAAEDDLGTALEGDAAGASVLWGNESRLWLSRVRRAQGYGFEADSMLEVVHREASGAGLARLARLAATEIER